MLGPESSKGTGVGESVSQTHMKMSDLYTAVCQVCGNNIKHSVLALCFDYYFRVYDLASLLSILQTPRL